MALNQRRLISTQIWEDEKFVQLSTDSQLLYLGMITLGDDDGRFRADKLYLRSKIFPYRDIAPDEVDRLCNEIVEVGLILVYETEKGTVGAHPKWTNHQQIRKDRYKSSQFDAPPSTNGKPDDNQRSTQVKKKEAKSKKPNTSSSKIDFSPREQMLKGLAGTSLAEQMK